MGTHDVGDSLGLFVAFVNPLDSFEGGEANCVWYRIGIGTETDIFNAITRFVFTIKLVFIDKYDGYTFIS